jgi:outer membrane protein with beta-barrel domain
MLAVMRAALVAVALLATAATARADGFYYSEAIGGARIKNQLGHLADSAFELRIGGGYRWGHFALEGFLQIDEASSTSQYGNLPDAQPCCWSNRHASIFSYGMDVKYIAPLGRHVELYLRGGPSYGHLRGLDLGEDYAGRGLEGGAGIQVKGKVPIIGLLFWPLFFTDLGPKMTGAIFLDDGYTFYRFHPRGDLDAGPAIDASIGHVSIGFAFGSDF